jgi:hypothetical protein
MSKATAASDCIRWGPAGDTIIVTDPIRFARDVLPRHFKHDNIRSFMRQLNIYGFQRCRGAAGGDGDTGQLEFYHEFFLEGRTGLMRNISRGVPSQKKRSAPGDDIPIIEDGRGELHAEMRAVHEEIVTVDSELRMQMHSLQRHMASLIETVGLQMAAQMQQQQQALPPTELELARRARRHGE